MSQLELGWPAMSDEALLCGLTKWLGPYLFGLSSRTDLQRINLAKIFEALLTWEQRRELDRCAPTHMAVPVASVSQSITAIPQLRPWR